LTHTHTGGSACDAPLAHRTTAMLVDYFGEAPRPHTMVLIEEVPDGGYARADEVFTVPEAYRAKD
jgi:4-oxalocrotonate tautomerase